MDVFLQPKTELDASPPRASQAPSAKPKFEPKAKPRAKARAPTKQQQQPQKEQQAPPPLQAKSEPSDPSLDIQVVLDEPSVSHVDVKPKLEPADSIAATHSPAKLKEDIEDVKPASIKEEEEPPVSPPGSPSFQETEVDTVIREIDVYLCPNINADTKVLHFVQWCWRIAFVIVV